MKVIYYALLHTAEEGGFCVEVPDVDGCITEGESIEECQAMAADALRLMLEDDVAAGKPLPYKTEWPEILEKADQDMGPVATVLPIEVIFPDRKHTPPRRLSISLPESVCETIDSFLVQAGTTRSGLLATAALEYIARQRACGTIASSEKPHTLIDGKDDPCARIRVKWGG